MKKSITISIICGALLSACGGSENGPGGGETGQHAGDVQLEDIQQIIAPNTSAIGTLPPSPMPDLPNQSIQGVDSNASSVRDDVEIAIAKIVLHDGGNAGDYYSLIDIVRRIQPSEAVESIDMKRFHCDYISLSENIRNQISSGMIIALVTDTSARKKLFYQNVINNSGSLGAEVCS